LRDGQGEGRVEEVTRANRAAPSHEPFLTGRRKAPACIFFSQNLQDERDPMIKLLTCQTWVTDWDWFVYARQHQGQVPFLLVDRSPCTDPFFDPYASSEERRPIISGLCRCLKNFHKGDIYIYITRVDHRVCRALGIPMGNTTASYLGIAALTVAKVYESHAVAAATFTSRRYVVAPAPTPYPPNLAHEPHTPAAVLRDSCIVSRDRAHSTPDCSTDVWWRQQLKIYHRRQRERQLRVAECRLQQVGSRDVLQLNPVHAPVLTPADWGSEQMNVNGIWLQATQADSLSRLIASGR
jgi:hypothetical protein